MSYILENNRIISKSHNISSLYHCSNYKKYDCIWKKLHLLLLSIIFSKKILFCSLKFPITNIKCCLFYIVTMPWDIFFLISRSFYLSHFRFILRRSAFFRGSKLKNFVFLELLITSWMQSPRHPFLVQENCFDTVIFQRHKYCVLDTLLITKIIPRS